MEGRIYDPDIISHFLYDLGMDYELLELCDILIVYLASYHIVQPFGFGLFQIHGFSFRDLYLIYLIYDLLIPRNRYLRPVFPVNLVSVVFRRVMACSDDDSRYAVKLP